MRAKNREINIFNMSLLDILTGMLGAFLFLMVGLVPYYAKVMNSQVMTAEDKAKLDELKKLLEKGLKGPLSPEEAEELRQELERLEGENARLQADNNQLKSDKEQLQTELDGAKEKLEAVSSERDFWRTNDVRIDVVTEWRNPDVDIDVMVWGPSGRIYGPKKQKLLGKEVTNDGMDSHVSGKSSNEGIVVRPEVSGDYLVFYRVPPDAQPASYQSLFGYVVFSSSLYLEKNKPGIAYVYQSGLGASNSGQAKPGGIYAWATITYDAVKHSATVVAPTGKLPPGIQLLPSAPENPAGAVPVPQ